MTTGYPKYNETITDVSQLGTVDLRQLRLDLKNVRLRLGHALYMAGLAADAAARGGTPIPPSPEIATLRAWESAILMAIRSRIAAAVPATLSESDEVNQLDSFAPIVFLPVRIETRFDLTTSPAKLKVRVYPDDIFAQSHEAALTDAEVSAVRAHHNVVGRATTQDQYDKLLVEQWAQLARQVSPERAAYLLNILPPPEFSATGAGSYAWTPYADLAMRPSSWSRPIEAVLPDRWIVAAYRNGQVRIVHGQPVVEPLALSGAPYGLDADTRTVSGDLKVDGELLWTLNYDEAVRVGMAVTVPLSAEEAAIGTGGFDRLVVFGVKSSMHARVQRPNSSDAGPIEYDYDTSEHLSDLFDGHHFTRGFGFITPGTPTNNTEGRRTETPRSDPEFLKSYSDERLPPDPEAGDQDSLVWASAMGLAWDTASAAENGERRDRALAISMNRIMWPASLGYIMEEMMFTQDNHPVFSLATIEKAKDFFTYNVIPRGNIPSFRIGGVPYGVLPTMSINRWTALSSASSADIQSSVIPAMRKLRTLWLEASRQVPTLRQDAQKPLERLMQVLMLHPSSRELWVRRATGPIAAATFVDAFFANLYQYFKSLVEHSTSAFEKIGFSQWNLTRLGLLTFDEQADRLTLPLVAPNDELSGDQSLPVNDNNKNTLAFLAAASFFDIFEDTNAPLAPELRATLLYVLARHALLAEMTSQGQKLYREKQGQLDRLEHPEVIRAHPVLPISALMNKQYLFGTKPNEVLRTIAEEVKANRIGSLTDAMSELSALPTLELQRLFSETLDVVSHRLDAWLTGFAADRLRALRPESAKPDTNYFGGYAWVENLRPIQRTTVNGLEIQPDNGGFIHAPTMEHARAAAVLRNGALSEGKVDPRRYAIDLSSDRVRTARSVLDEVRAGQAIGAVLGYRFERALKEKHAGVSGLDVYRYVLRRMFPTTGAAPAGGNDVVDSVAATHVVNGLKLWRTFQKKRATIDAAADLPPPGTPAYDAIHQEIQALGTIVDAVSDLLTAESVFQLVRGNPGGAAATVDSLASGSNPPDPEIAQVRTNGVAFNQRVALLLSDLPDLPAGWPAVAVSRPDRLFTRSTLAGDLDRWVGGLIGKPTDVACAVTTSLNGVDISFVVTLADLGLRPLDFVAVAQASTGETPNSPIDRWIAGFALEQHPGATIKGIDYAKTGGVGSFPDALELARAIGDLLAPSRRLELEDLVHPGEVDEVDPVAENALSDIARSLKGELTNIEVQLEGIAATLSGSVGGAALRTAMARAAAVLPAYYPWAQTDQELQPIRDSLLQELKRRQSGSAQVPIPDVKLAPARDVLAAVTKRAKALLGDWFTPIISTSLVGQPELQNSLSYKSDLLSRPGNLGEPTVDLLAPTKFLQQASLTREPLIAWRRLSTYTNALGRRRPGYEVVQLPAVKGERWMGVEQTGIEVPRGRLSVLLLNPGTTTTPFNGGTTSGLILDEWVEVIPERTQDTAIAFHHDNPAAEAPQAILIAVPSSAGPKWSLDDILATLNETLDLAKIRSVDPSQVPLGQLLPALLLTENLAGFTVSTTLRKGRVGPLQFEP